MWKINESCQTFQWKLLAWMNPPVAFGLCECNTSEPRQHLHNCIADKGGKWEAWIATWTMVARLFWHRSALGCSQIGSTWLSPSETSSRWCQYTQRPYTFLCIHLLLTCLFPFAFCGPMTSRACFQKKKKCFQKVTGQTVVIKGSTETAGKIMWPQCQSQLASILWASPCSVGCASSAAMCGSNQDAFH